jgi:hypothetical protein
MTKPKTRADLARSLDVEWLRGLSARMIQVQSALVERWRWEMHERNGG